MEHALQLPQHSLLEKARQVITEITSDCLFEALALCIGITITFGGLMAAFSHM